MSTMARVETQTVAGTDVREVAGAIWQEIIEIYALYARRFPYEKQRLRGDLAQMLLWDMADKVIVQFYDSQKVERLSYEYTPLSDPAAVHERGLCSNGTENWEVHAKHPVRRDPGEDATPPEPRTLTTRTSNVPGS